MTNKTSILEIRYIPAIRIRFSVFMNKKSRGAKFYVNNSSI